MAERHLTRRRTLQATGVAIASALAGCGGGGGGDGDGGGGDDEQQVEADLTITVGGEGGHWEPAEAEASVGDTVAFEAKSDQHFISTVASPDDANWNGWSTSALNTGDRRTHTFEVPGTYEYNCRYHSGSGAGVLTITGSGGSDSGTDSGSDAGNTTDTGSDSNSTSGS